MKEAIRSLDEVGPFIAGIVPGTIEHEALKDVLFIELNRHRRDNGKMYSRNYEDRQKQIQTRKLVPEYEAAFNRINGLHQELTSLENNSLIGHKNALKREMEEAIKFGLIKPEARALLIE